MQKTEHVKYISKDENKIVDFLKRLPNDTDNSYTKELISLVVKKSAELKDELYKILKKYYNKNDKVSFAAFYGLVVYYRRYKMFSELEKLVNIYGEKYKDKPLYNVAMCTIYRNKGTEIDLQLALNYAKSAVDLCCNHQGILQTYADTVAYSLEQGYTVSEDILENALNCIKKAIEIDRQYPKYYCTVGRLLIYKKDYKKAKFYILKAIDLEDPIQKDYAVRIADYQNFLQRCYTNESIYKIDESVKNTLKKLENVKTEVGVQIEKQKLSHLEFLGFFTAIISLIMATIQFTVAYNAIDAAALIVILLGILIISIIVFSIVLGIERINKGKIIMLILIGILCILGGMIMVFAMNIKK